MTSLTETIQARIDGCRRVSADFDTLILKPHDYEQTLLALKRAVEVLNIMASWGEGSKVTGLFDEPGAASDARDALAEISETLLGAEG